jgi:hypothetical protein
MLHLVLLIASSFIYLISAALPSFTIGSIDVGIENGVDIAKSLVGHFTSNDVFTSDDGPELADQLVHTPFQANNYQFRLEKITRSGTLDGGFTAKNSINLFVMDGTKTFKVELFLEFKHQESLETPKYAQLDRFQYRQCKKLYRPTNIVVVLTHV